MKTLSAFALMTITLLAVPGASTAQTASADVTVKIPVDLKNFGPDLAKVKVECTIISDAITNGTGAGNHYMTKAQELPMSGGAVNTTVSIVFNFTQLDNPVGKPAQLSCNLLGWSTSAQSWIGSPDPNQSNPSFRTIGAIKTSDGSGFSW
jgi:hypothetical protein